MLTSRLVGGQSIRRAAVAGSWYPGEPTALSAAIDAYLAQAAPVPQGSVVAIIAPHAGLVYSGAVAACAYRAVMGRAIDVVVLVGPSHFMGFDGIALGQAEAFETPLGLLPVDRECAAAIAAASPLVRRDAAAHAREHSLEMQLPFLCRALPGTPIVPLLMGYQTRATITALAVALQTALADRRALLVASTDLSHYCDAETASALDGCVVDLVARLDVAGLLERFEDCPEVERGRFVACGGGPAIAVMQAACGLGAREGRVLRYAHSGAVSGDTHAVVGYLAAALGTFAGPSHGAHRTSHVARRT